MYRLTDFGPDRRSGPTRGKGWNKTIPHAFRVGDSASGQAHQRSVDLVGRSHHKRGRAGFRYSVLSLRRHYIVSLRRKPTCSLADRTASAVLPAAPHRTKPWAWRLSSLWQSLLGRSFSILLASAFFYAYRKGGDRFACEGRLRKGPTEPVCLVAKL